MKKNPLFCFAATALLGFTLVSCGEPTAGDVSSSENEISSSESLITKYLVTFDINGGKLPTGISEIPSQEVEEGHWATKPLARWANATRRHFHHLRGYRHNSGVCVQAFRIGLKGVSFHHPSFQHL